jgi:hypothetical protein
LGGENGGGLRRCCTSVSGPHCAAGSRQKLRPSQVCLFAAAECGCWALGPAERGTLAGCQADRPPPVALGQILPDTFAHTTRHALRCVCTYLHTPYCMRKHQKFPAPDPEEGNTTVIQLIGDSHCERGFPDEKTHTPPAALGCPDLGARGAWCGRHSQAVASRDDARGERRNRCSVRGSASRRRQSAEPGRTVCTRS